MFLFCLLFFFLQVKLDSIVLKQLQDIIEQYLKIHEEFKSIHHKLNPNVTKLMGTQAKIGVIDGIVKGGKISKTSFHTLKKLNSSLPDDKQVDISGMKIYELKSNAEFDIAMFDLGLGTVDICQKNEHLTRNQIKQLEMIVKSLVFIFLFV